MSSARAMKGHCSTSQGRKSKSSSASRIQMMGTADTGERRAQADADRRDNQHQRLVGRIGKDHRYQAERIDRLGEAVIDVEAGLDSERRGCSDERGEGGEGLVVRCWTLR